MGCLRVRRRDRLHFFNHKYMKKEIKAVCILHGSFGFPFENWFPWLHNNLTENGSKCYVPHFPTPEGQTFEQWASILDAYFENGLLDEHSILIAHSSAPIFVVKYLLNRKQKIAKLITISGFNQFHMGNDAFDSINKKFFVDKEEVKHIHEFCEKIVCFISENDPYLPFDVLMGFAQSIGGQVINMPSAGHFNSVMGYIRFAELLEYL